MIIKYLINNVITGFNIFSKISSRKKHDNKVIKLTWALTYQWHIMIAKTRFQELTCSLKMLVVGTAKYFSNTLKKNVAKYFSNASRTLYFRIPRS